MVQQLLYILIISVCCMTWGLPVFFWLEKKGIGSRWYGSRISTLVFLFFSGLLTLSLLSSWTVLFLPLRFDFLIYATLVLLFLLYFFYRKYLSRLRSYFGTKEGFTWVDNVFICSCLLLFILLGSLSPVNIDTQLYHLQSIRWTHEYGTVPGLANLYPRLGLLSSWFNLISLFYIPCFDHQNFTYLNTTVTIWFLLWLVCKLAQYRGMVNAMGAYRAFPAFFLLLIAYFLYDWQLFRDTANSTSYDFIVTICTVYLIVFFAEEFLSPGKKSFSLIPLAIAILIVPFKLSGIFIIFPLTYYMWYHRSAVSWMKSIVTGLIILTPMLIRNYFVSGYPLYPSTIALGTPAWQLPHDMALKFREYVLYVNKFYNSEVSFIMHYKKSGFNWLPFWFHGILLKHKIVLGLSFLSLALLFYKPFTILYTSKFKVFILTLWLMMVCWFLTAPDPRFAFGFLLFLSFFPVALTISRLRFSTKFIYPVSLLTTLLVVVYAVKRSGVLAGDTDYLFSVTETVSPPYQPGVINGTTYNITEKVSDNWNNRCFFTPLPCLCEPNPFIKMRSGNLKDGFLMSPRPDSSYTSNYNY